MYHRRSHQIEPECRISTCELSAEERETYSKVKGDLCALLLNVRVEALLSVWRELVCQSCRRHKRGQEAQKAEQGEQRCHVEQDCDKSRWYATAKDVVVQMLLP
jgi:hypothetical protein